MFSWITRRPMAEPAPPSGSSSRCSARGCSPARGTSGAASATWRHQRRTLAPAFTPRSVELLVPHIRSATHEMVIRLAAGEQQQVDLFPMIQHLALEIAGRTMFSLETRQYGSALRRQIMHYGQGLGRPHLLDFVVPIGIPTPYDLARAWFRRQMSVSDAGLAAALLWEDRCS